MSVTKICTFCGQPTDSVLCPNCQSDYSDGFEALPDFGYKPPEEIFYAKSTYTNWLERMKQYEPIIYPELDEGTRLFVDMGCGPNQFVSDLNQRFPHIRGIGLDQYQRAENIVTIDFENEQLPFADDEIDVILISHVLEHLERLHFVLENAIRASKKIIIALPNYCVLTMLGRYRVGEFRGLYGLPLVQPKDRHRWIYMVPEMDRFIGYHAWKFGLDYRTHYFLHRRSPPLLSRLFRKRFIYEAVYVLEKGGRR